MTRHAKRGRGARGRSRARMGRSSRSPMAEAADPRWDRDARQQSTDFVLGVGLRANRQGRTEIAISEHPKNRLASTEFGELEVLEVAPTPLPAPAVIGATSADDAVVELQVTVTRLTQILREQGLVI